ncbi:hypothetical protein DPV78_006462 [Talaromyces pinophilus]|nr:hypothetical protein DPV78_006462 [Talaromyces pinophilus]
MSTNESQETTNGADVSDIAINQLLGQTLATAMEKTVNTAIANAVENAINAAVDNAVNDVQEAVNKSLKRSIDQTARDAVEKAIKKLRDGCFEQHLTTFLSKNEDQASQKATAPTEATNDQAKSIKVVKDFHRHASDFVYPGRTYQIYVQDHATDHDYYRMLYSHPALLLQLASPEQVESGEVRASRCNWKCFKKVNGISFRQLLDKALITTAGKIVDTAVEKAAKKSVKEAVDEAVKDAMKKAVDEAVQTAVKQATHESSELSNTDTEIKVEEDLDSDPDSAVRPGCSYHIHVPHSVDLILGVTDHPWLFLEHGGNGEFMSAPTLSYEWTCVEKNGYISFYNEMSKRYFRQKIWPVTKVIWLQVAMTRITCFAYDETPQMTQTASNICSMGIYARSNPMLITMS